MQRLHAEEQRQANQCRQQQMKKLSPFGARLVGRNTDDHPTEAAVSAAAPTNRCTPPEISSRPVG
jgi:hypothetical protein